MSNFGLGRIKSGSVLRKVVESDPQWDELWYLSCTKMASYSGYDRCLCDKSGGKKLWKETMADQEIPAPLTVILTGNTKSKYYQ